MHNTQSIPIGRPTLNQEYYCKLIGDDDDTNLNINMPYFFNAGAVHLNGNNVMSALYAYNDLKDYDLDVKFSSTVTAWVKYASSHADGSSSCILPYRYAQNSGTV